ncbi:hypothetical protein SAMN04488168_15412 [Bacillus sp. 491mf]|uniref:hypothetical protein n=1 Tax=Bacillus TaxID=1386 RepID=UPI000558C9B8|nr:MULTISPECIES: hypothetical protein [Bacillus]SFD58773.1 hypothetical protein SAMN04488168_15412 [Bacillus sp. 491mf]
MNNEKKTNSETTVKSKRTTPFINLCIFTLSGCNVSEKEIKKQVELATKIWKIEFVITSITMLKDFSIRTNDTSFRKKQSKNIKQLFSERKYLFPNPNSISIFYTNARHLSNNTTGRSFSSLMTKSRFNHIILTKSSLENTLAHELGHILFYSHRKLQGKNPDTNSYRTHSLDSKNIMFGTATTRKRQTTSLQRTKALESTLIKYR